jgi:hypothetical protein
VHFLAPLRLAIVFVVGALVLPTAASALTVTVTIHGAGGVFETENSLGGTRNQGSCSVDPLAKTPASVTECVLGSPDELWNSGDVVRLLPLQNSDVAAYNAGWRFDKWYDGSGAGEVNCDPAETTGDHTAFACEFQIVENVSLDLYFKDTAGPDTHFTHNVADFTNSKTAAFEFDSSTDSDATFECKLDGPAGDGSYYDCGGPDDKAETLTNLGDGTYTFSVRGTDNNGNVESTPASQTWVVDTVKPAVSMSLPAEWEYLAVNGFTPVYAIEDPHLNAGSVACLLDSVLIACGPLSGLSQGYHTFTVRGSDCCANFGAVTHPFVVDTVVPNTKITSGPSGETSGRTATFRFKRTNFEYGGVDFFCRLDTSVWKSCSSPKSYSVSRGRHTFRVKAVDVVGHEEASPAVRSWKRT